MSGVNQVTTQVVDGKPADYIIAAAEYEKADMIVWADEVSATSRAFIWVAYRTR